MGRVSEACLERGICRSRPPTGRASIGACAAIMRTATSISSSPTLATTRGPRLVSSSATAAVASSRPLRAASPPSPCTPPGPTGPSACTVSNPRPRRMPSYASHVLGSVDADGDLDLLFTTTRLCATFSGTFQCLNPPNMCVAAYRTRVRCIAHTTCQDPIFKLWCAQPLHQQGCIQLV